MKHGWAHSFSEEHQRSAESHEDTEGERRLAVGPAGGHESEPDDDRQQVGVEERFEEVERADPGQAEAKDEGQPHVAEGHPARVHQVHHEEECDRRDPAQRRQNESIPLARGQSDDHPTADDGHAQRVHERLGDQAAHQVAVGELDETDE